MIITICDNDYQHINHLINLIDDYFHYRNISLQDIHTCCSVDRAIELAQICDLLFLDVELGEESGIDIGMKIKAMNLHCKIIITSAFQSYLIEGYKINARRYLLKPIERIEFFIEMDSIMNDYFKNQQGFIDESIQRDKIYYHQILFIEAYDRKTKITLENGKTGIVNYTLSEWKSILKNQPFGQSHKSVIVNYKAIQLIGKQDIHLNNKQIVPISRHFRREFQKKYREFLQYEDYE